MASAQGGGKAKYTPAQAKALEEWSYSLALDAATYGSPTVIMYLLRYNDAVGPKPLAPPNNLWRMENISTPELAEKSGYVLPNCSTIYGFGFLDLRQEPVILTLPDSAGRYYMVETVDMWTNAFAYPAGLHAGYKGGKVAYVAPGWKGVLPEDVKRIDCPTPWILIQPRVHLPNPSELEATRKVLAGIIPQGLSKFTGKPAPQAPTDNYLAPKRKDTKLPVSTMNFVDPLQFWDILSAVMNENPPPASQVKAVLPMYKPLGIELGKQWDRAKVDPIILKSMARAAENIPTVLAQLPFGRVSNGWFVPPATIGNPKTDYKTRAVIAVIGLTGNAAQEAIYYDGRVDADGKLLTGANKYTITFAKGQTPPRSWQ
jgi:DNA sulfur modification protein DndE